MFNREYQKRATRLGLASGNIAADATLRLPWAGIFEPWRPFVMTAIAEERRQRPKPKTAAKGCKKSTQRLLFDGKLRGLQLVLFPDNDVNKFTTDPARKARQTPADSEFPSLALMVDPLNEDELADEFNKLFPL